MRLKLHHVGLIDDADLDLRPLTVFVGENGTNKTWAAACAHGLLWATSRQGTRYEIRREVDDTPHHATIRRLLKGILAQQADAIPVKMAFDRESALDLNGAGEWLADMLGLPPESLPESASAALRKNQLELLDPTVTLVVFPGPTQTRFRATAVTRSGRSFERSFELLAGPDGESSLDLAVGLLGRIAFADFGRVLFLPADRKALTALAANRAANQALWQTAEDLPFTWRTFVDLLEECRTPQRAAGDFSELAEFLHGTTGGTTVSDPSTYGFQVLGGPLLPLIGSASLTRAVGGLDLYLQRLAQPGDVIIIDELEMNAHPKAQLALVELMAMMVQRNLRVIFTTHSPYIVDHLNTLMYAAGLPDDRKHELARDFALQSAEAFISPDKVAAHLFIKNQAGKVEVKDVLHRDTGRIDWQTFSEQSDRLGTLWDKVDDALHAPPPKPPAKKRRPNETSKVAS